MQKRNLFLNSAAENSLKITLNYSTNIFIANLGEIKLKLKFLNGEKLFQCSNALYKCLRFRNV